MSTKEIIEFLFMQRIKYANVPYSTYDYLSAYHRHKLADILYILDVL